MKYEKKISICMMIKNEEKNLPRCLESLKPIVDSGLAELIIIDTGSEDKSIEIAKRYTDKVYEHPWGDDFSEMRNISISYAKGEWIWIVDADEELEKPEDIIFLYNQDLSKYNTIIITVQNYMKTPMEGELEEYNISISKRGFRNSNDFRYEGAVHNQPLAKEPYLTSNIIIKHYGYIWEDQEFKQKKFERTAGILQKELKKDPKNIYYQFQLATSWSNIDPYRGLVEMRKAHQLIKRLPFKKRIGYLYVYGIYARIAYQNKKYIEAIEICKEGLSHSRDYIDLWYLAGICSGMINDTESALEYLEGFLELRKSFDTTILSKDPAFTFYHMNNESENMVLYNIATISCNEEEYDKAIDYASKIEQSDLKTTIIVRISKESDNSDILITYFDEIYKEKKMKQVLIRNIENQYIKVDSSMVIYNKIIDLYDKRGGQNEPYYLLNRTRMNIAEQITIGEFLQEQLLALPYDDFEDYYGDIILYLIKEKVNLKEFKNIGSIENINRFMQYIVAKHEDYHEIILLYLNKVKSVEQIQEARYWIVLARYVLLSERLDKDQHVKVFKQYMDQGIQYIKEVYNPQVLKDEMIYDMNQAEHRFFLYLDKANEYRDEKPEVYINYLRKALKEYPMAKGIELLLSEFQIEQNNKVANEENEFEEYKKLVKANINTLLEAKKVIEAKDIIDEYLKILPGDLEMLVLKSEIQLQYS